MKILLSPAKSINEQCTFPSVTFSQPQFAKEAKSLVAKLKKLKTKDLMDLMHVSKDIAELNVNRFKQWHLTESPTEQVKPAGYLFTGEVYRGLDLASLSEEHTAKAQEQVRILSGMYGLLRPFDLMFPYRLEMGTKFSPKPELTNLYQFWGEKLTKALVKELSKNEPIVNLASNEYAKAIQWKKIKQPVITPVFKEFKGGEYKIVMMYAKHQRGAMARYILENNITELESLKGYQLDGYHFNAPLSTDSEWVFTR
jgi:uncharacterized protein